MVLASIGAAYVRRIGVVSLSVCLSILLVVAVPLSGGAAAGEPPKAGEEEKPSREEKAPDGGEADEKEGAEKDGDAGDPAKTKATPSDPDEAYVREHLEEYLSPTTIEFKDDGRAHLVFNFGQKNESQSTSFTPNISASATSIFRWALEGEFIMDSWGRAGGKDVGVATEGLRISNAGMAHLNLVFKDDVEAQISYGQCVVSTTKQTIAVVYTNASGNSLGSNFGTQCAFFSRGRLSKVSGDIKLIASETETLLKLVVKDGKFSAWREGREKSSLAYSPKTYSSGQVGIIWGGGIASFLHRLEVAGSIDYKKTAALMKKKRR